MHDFLLGTLFLPISDRAFVLSDWEHSLTHLNLPKDRFQVILSDSTGGSPVGVKAESIVRSLGYDFVTINRFKQKSMPDSRKKWGNYISIGEMVAETYEKGMVGIRGPLFLCFEDDILIHPNTFLVLIDEMLSINKCGMLSACTYTKSIDKQNIINNTEIIAWDVNDEQLIDNINIPHLTDCKGTAFGCFVTYSNLIQHFPLIDSVLDNLSSPDLAYCKYIRTNHNLRVCTTSHVKTQHVFEINNEKYIAGKIECPDIYKELPESIELNNKRVIKKDRDHNSPVFIIGTSLNSGAYNIKDMVSGVKVWGDSSNIIRDIFSFHYRITEKRITSECGNNNNRYESCDSQQVINERLPNHSFKSPIEQLKSLFDWYYVTEYNPFWGVATEDFDTKMVNRLHYIYPGALFIFVYNKIHLACDPFNNHIDRDNIISNQILSNNSFQSFFNNIPLNMHYFIIDFSEYKNNLNIINDIIEKELS